MIRLKTNCLPSVNGKNPVIPGAIVSSDYISKVMGITEPGAIGRYCSGQLEYVVICFIAVILTHDIFIVLGIGTSGLAASKLLNR